MRTMPTARRARKRPLRITMTHDGLTFRRLASLDDYAEAVAIQQETWGSGFSESVPPAILMVGQKVGGVTAGAFDDSGRMLGFVFGLTGVRDGRVVHWSDMLAVRHDARGRGIGDQLKRFQRELVVAVGARAMLWTYDPLVARNAHLNLVRLGARVVEYAPDMYGSNTGSTLHGALPTDRLVVEWDLGDDERGPSPSTGEVSAVGASRLPEPDGPAAPGDAVPALSSDHEGIPTVRLRDEPLVSIEVPLDWDAMLATPGELPRRWRLAAREAFQYYLGRGGRVRTFVRADGGQPPRYILETPRA